MDRAAWANQVYPLDEGGAEVPATSAVERGAERPVTLTPGTPTLERWRSLQLVMIRSFSVTARISINPSDEGIVMAHGDQGGGYSMWLDAAGVHRPITAVGDCWRPSMRPVPTAARTHRRRLWRRGQCLERDVERRRHQGGRRRRLDLPLPHGSI
jgi:arylsulfatase